MSDLTPIQPLYSEIRQLAKNLRIYQTEPPFCEGLTFVQFNILDYVIEEGSIEQSDLKDKLSVEKSTLTRLLDPLARKEFITRERSSENSRIVILKATTKGRETHGKVWACLEEYLGGMTDVISPEKLAVLLEGVKYLNQVFAQCQCSKCAV